MTPHFSVENDSSFELESDRLSSVLAQICELEGISQSVNVLLTSDEAVRALNARFRGIDSPTDVLTFPSGEGLPFPLGDIAVSVPYAKLQAEARGVELHDELIALIVHGVLHLLGHDDETDAERLKMQSRMNEIGEMIGTPIDASWTSVLHQSGEEDGE